MKVNKTFLGCCLVVLASSLAGQTKVADFPRAITLTIDRHPGWLGGDQEGDDLNIRCTFVNRGKKPVTVLLADHDDYIGTMPYPVGLKARITTNDGSVITRTTDFGDWWTWYYHSSDGYREMPGDRITLNPGAQVVRIVPLAIVLRGLPPLRAGQYNVELSLGEIVSNRLMLKVAAKA